MLRNTKNQKHLIKEEMIIKESSKDNNNNKIMKMKNAWMMRSITLMEKKRMKMKKMMGMIKYSEEVLRHLIYHR